MNIYVFSDESGVFDRNHERFYVFGGIILLGNDARDVCSRKYIKAEKDVKASIGMPEEEEAKASRLENKNRGKLFRSLNQEYKFGVVVDMHKLNENIWTSKKHKQRYLDYAYKIAVKRHLEALVKEGKLDPASVENIYFFVDEHTTATNGCYELGQALERELKYGTFNQSWAIFYPPIFPHVRTVALKYCNSSTKTLIRSADIIANRIYFYVRRDENYASKDLKLHVIRLP